MASIFERIISGEIPSYKVAETELSYAFLDIRPVQKGHVLVVPKLACDHFDALPEVFRNDLMHLASLIASAQKSYFSCIRVGYVVMGFEVPHAHLHLIPLNNMDELNFKKAAVEVSSEEMVEIANSLSALLP